MDRNLVLVILKDWFWRRANATSKCSKFGLQTSIVKDYEGVNLDTLQLW
jgi:hypothetical protein